VFLSGLFPLRPDGTLGEGLNYSFWGTFPAPSQSTINVAPFNTSVMFHSISILNLALPLDPNLPTGPKGPTPASFCYHVETRARDASYFEQVIDRVPDAGSPAIAACGNRAGVLRYDIQNAAIAPINTRNFILGAPTAARPLFVDIEGGAITGAVNPALLAAQPGTKLLILHHHNAPFAQAEIVNINPPVAVAALEGTSWMRVPLTMR
nr:hypothetical protein [Chloroflexota bacterium]